MREHSAGACLVLMGMPTPPQAEGGEGGGGVAVGAAMDWVEVMRSVTQDLPPVAVCRFSQGQPCITSEI